jgi:kynurenine formamidase
LLKVTHLHNVHAPAPPRRWRTTAQGTVVVEGLDLSAVPTGRHHLTCLPLLLVGSDGAPGRCILQTNSRVASK